MTQFIRHAVTPYHKRLPARQPMMIKLATTVIAAVSALLSLTAAAQMITSVPAYVGSQACAECHRDIARDWAGSHHAAAWQSPAPPHVLGDFTAAPLRYADREARFTASEDGYFIEIDDATGTRREFPIVGTVGIAPLQQYLVETEPGRLQVPDVAWDTERRRWYHLYPETVPPPGDGMHWTGVYKNWNSHCAECHATGYTKAYDAATRRYASSQSEIGVGCEACHGPATEHVAWATGAAPDSPDRGLLMAFAGASARAEIEQCASCHSRREPLGGGSPPAGASFHDYYQPRLLDEPLYYPDGRMREEVYEYGSFLQSRMYAAGVRCTDCHDPHSGALRAGDNALCTRCHGAQGDERFPGLRKAAYDTPAHHFHAPGSDGAACIGCHMQRETYLLTDRRHDHFFRVPRPDLTEKLGVPNPCNACHADRTAAWAIDRIGERFPDAGRRGPHYGEVFAAARHRPETTTRRDLLTIASDTGMPEIVRATALGLLANAADAAIADATLGALRDPDPLVRAAAIALQRPLPTARRVARLLPLFRDKVGSVRIAAARGILDISPDEIPLTARAAIAAATREFEAVLVANADFPESQMAAGGAALVRRDFSAALPAFAEAARLDPQLIDAWVLIARLHAALGQPEEAAATVRRALAANPGNADLIRLQESR